MEETIDCWTGDEWISVELLNKNTGILKESSLNSDYSYNDMVLLDYESKEITQVIKKNTKTTFLSYSVVYGGEDKNWILVENFFIKNKIYIQKYEEGIFLLSTPLSFDDDDIKFLIKKCPVKCFEITQENISDENNDEDDEEDGLFYLN